MDKTKYKKRVKGINKRRNYKKKIKGSSFPIKLGLILLFTGILYLLLQLLFFSIDLIGKVI